MMALGARQAPTAASNGPTQPAIGNGTRQSYQKYLTNCKSFYSCIYCRTHLANHDELISRSFQGNRSRAYLFNSVINITTGPPVERELNTGSHAVADIFCSNCSTTIGWKYEKAFVESQKYKEGKFIIELAHVVRENRHLELDKRDMFLGALSTADLKSLLLPAPLANTAPTSHSAQLKATPSERRGCSLSSPEARWSTSSTSTGSSSPTADSSSSSSSSPSSSSASSHTAGSLQGQRHAHLVHLPGRRASEAPSSAVTRHTLLSAPADRAPDDGDSSEEEEDNEEEVLMFPFHDDLFGERASYSNLFNARLSSKRRRARRSLHLESTPYDWKYSTGSPRSAASATGACSPSTSLPSPKPTEDDDDDDDDHHDHHDEPHDDHRARKSSECCELKVLAASPARSEIQFEIDEVNPQPSSSSSTCAYPNSPTTLATTQTEVMTNTGINNHEGNDNDDDDDYDNNNNNNKNNSATGDKLNATGNSVSMDDEEFYDCCTDHTVSSSMDADDRDADD